MSAIIPLTKIKLSPEALEASHDSAPVTPTSGHANVAATGTSNSVNSATISTIATGSNSGSVSGPASSANSSGKTQTVFIHKLYDMLHDETISHLIWWSPSNDSFCLLPGEEFSKVLAQYFKHTNIASFIRQLNMYGFHKVNDTFQNNEDGSGTNANSVNSSGPSANSTNSSNPNKWEFRHSTNQFRKGDIESLKLIKRRSSKNINSHKEIVNLKSLPPTSNPIIDPHSGYGPAHGHYYGYSDDETSSIASSRSPHGSSDNLHQQYHQSLRIHQQSLLINNDGRTTPNGQIQHPSQQQQQIQQSQAQQLQGLGLSAPQSPAHTPIHQPLSPRLQPPPLVTNPSFENSINFKFIELNNQLSSLKNELNVMHQKYDSAHSELVRNQSDTLQLVEMLERFVQATEAAPEKPTINSNIFNNSNSNTIPTVTVSSNSARKDVPDRVSNNKTPIKSTGRQADDEGNTSPMSGAMFKSTTSSGISNSATSNSATSTALTSTSAASVSASGSSVTSAARALSGEIGSLKSILLQRLRASTQHQQPPLRVQHTSTSSSYHLDNAPHTTNNSRNPSNSNIQIVPQHYPLNPHYTIYPQSEFRGPDLSQNQNQNQNQHTKSITEESVSANRHLSILMEPLQPMPTRNPILDEQSTNFRLRAESKSYSPLTVGGASGQLPTSSGNVTQAHGTQLQTPAHLHTQPPNVNGTGGSQQNSQSSSRSSVVEKKTNSRSSSLINTPAGHDSGKPSFQQYPFPQVNSHSTHLHSYHNGSTRTNSLPNPPIDHSVTTPLTPTEPPSSNPSYFNQRNSFTSMYDSHQQQGQSYRVPPYSQQPTSMPKPTGPITSSPISTTSPSRLQESSEFATSMSKNQLPSVSELDKSIKGASSNVPKSATTLPPLHSSPMFALLNKDNDDDKIIKKRKT